jgi:hypothetical protein
MCPPHLLAGQAKPKPFPPAGKTTIDPWVTAFRTVTHPDAPAAGRGFGSFRGPAPLGTDGDPRDSLPHPLAPAARFVDLDRLHDKAVELQQPLANAPPVVTSDTTQTVSGVKVTTKADANDSTDPDFLAAGTDAGTIARYQAKPPEATINNDTGRVVSFVGRAEITLTIQTHYRAGASPAGTSAYGRGTTCPDKKNGDTTLGFHESRHRRDALDFLRNQQNNPLPTFKGKAGMTREEYEQAYDDFVKAVEVDYQVKSDTYSDQKTDEVGCPTKTEYDRNEDKDCKCPGPDEPE